MRTRILSSIAIAIVCWCIPLLSWSHAEHDKPRFVSSTGQDKGRCDNMFRPCRTIGYAATQAGKGDRVLVAAGTYELTTAEELFYVTSGIVQIHGGYSPIDHYQKQASSDNPTVLVGVPAEFRDALAKLGFNVIVDRKGQDQATAETEQLRKSFAAMQASAANAPCSGGFAGAFPCSNVDLIAHMALGDFRANPSAANDVWGLVDLNTLREYAIIGLRNGTAVVDVTTPDQPVEVGFVSGLDSVWRDIKVYQLFDRVDNRWKAYAYVTTDAASDRLTIIDLSDLPNQISLAARVTDDLSAHNVYIADVDYTTGVAVSDRVPVMFIAGSNLNSGAYRAYSLADPLSPQLIGTSTSRGYMHDATSLSIDDARKDTQCVNAVDQCNVLVDFNESTFDIWDASDVANAALLNTSAYAGSGYVHSGWWSEDKQYLFVHDELDEQRNSLPTTLRVFNIASLLSPALSGSWTGPTLAIDHNGFVRGNRYYMSNYTRGLTILDITQPASPVETGRFDTYTVSDSSSFNGAWGVYPFLPSGVILISDINSGLYILADNTRDVSQGRLSFLAHTHSGEEGSAVSITVSRDGGTTGIAEVGYETVGGSVDSSDLQSAKGTLSWAAGDGAAKTVNINLSADGQQEGTEQFFVRLFDPRNGTTLGTPNISSVFVHDPGAPAQVSLLSPSVVADESTGRVYATVQRIGNMDLPASVSYHTEARSADDGTDYVGITNGQLNWPVGDGTGRVIEIDLVDDQDEESNETFRIVLSNPVDAALGAIDTGTITIADNDGNSAPAANAGVNQTVSEGSFVTLSGGASSDPDNDPLSFSWTQTAGPNVPLAGASQATASFTAPAVSGRTTLTFRLNVTDTVGLSSTDTVRVTVTDTSTSDGGAVDLGLLTVLLLAFFWLYRRRRSASY